MSGDPILRSLLNTYQALTGLQQQFCSAVPAYLADSCQVTGLRNGTLSVAASNGTVAAKLRQLAPQIVTQLQDRGCEVSGIRVRVQVSYAVLPPKRTPRILSAKARGRLHELSEHLPDSPLKQALEKFSKN
jgi:hypothetical protein